MRVRKGLGARRPLFYAVLVVSLVLFAGLASADPASDLSQAESRAAAAEADVAAARDRLDTARAELDAASRQAGPAAEAAQTARMEVQELLTSLNERQRQARERIAELETTQQEEEDDYDEEVAAGIGAGLALLVAAGIALSWGWFRASSAVAALVRMQLGQAVALCVGGGFLLVVIGVALVASGGLPGALGMALFCLGFFLPLALLLARHSAEIQRGRSKPVLGRDRLPDWVGRAAAVLLVLLGVGALVAVIVAESPAPADISVQLHEDASALTTGPGAARLAEAKSDARAVRKQAIGPLARQRQAQAELREVTRDLHRAEARLVGAEADAHRSARRLAALIEREQREAEAQAEAEAEEIEEEMSPSCDPNYSGCVPPYPPDVDCAEVGGPVSVYGADPHGLDADGDGVGCE